MEDFSIEQFFLKASIMLVPGLLAITCHEVSHGFVADKLGDKTARMMGRLTLNPLKHIDIIGTLMLFIVHIGWAKPVPVNNRNLRRPKTDMIWVAVAGPVTNFVLATISAIGLRLIGHFESDIAATSLTASILKPVAWNLAFSVYINLLLALFNLIPVPPLDGGRVAVGLLPYRLSSALERVEPFGMIIIILLVFFTPVFDYVILPAMNLLVYLLAGPQTALVAGVTGLMTQ